MRLPNDTQHIAIVGRNGSGKSQAAVWHLANRSWDLQPWVIYDYKRDELIGGIPGAKIWPVESRPPNEPGIFIVQPRPDDILPVALQMESIWENENTGVYVDEGYMVCSPERPNPAFRALLTQGRSKHCPIIINSQRPVWLDRFVFSEATFFQVFALNDKRDRQTMRAFIPADLETKLPDYHSYYHDVGMDETIVLKPVPNKSGIYSIFQNRLDEIERKKREGITLDPRKVLVI
jgi:hypothetical protein